MTLTQPTPPEIPGTFTIEAQPFPDIGWVANRKWKGDPRGLYCYADSWRLLREKVRDIGWSHVRMGGNPTKGDMQALESDGIVPSLHVLHGLPRKAYGSDEAFIQDKLKALPHVLDRYPDLKYAHIWNEPNFKYLLDLPANVPANQLAKAKLYGKLLLRSSEVIRSLRPDLKILGFETGGAGPNAVEFIRLVYDEFGDSIHDAYDILALHPGVQPNPPDATVVQPWGEYSIASQVRDCRQMMRGRGRKPIWFTEGGWTIASGKYESTSVAPVSELLQAAYVVRYYLTALRLGVDRVCPFFIVDTDNLNSGFFDGVVPRLSALAVQNMIDILPAPKLLGELHDGEDGRYYYKFADVSGSAQKPTWVAWDVNGPSELSLVVGDPRLTVIDMLGVQEDIAGEIITTGSDRPGYSYEIPIGPCPVYIR